MDGRVVWHAVDARVRVEIFVHGDLEDRRAPIPISSKHKWHISPSLHSARLNAHLEMMVEYARKNTQIRYHRSPYLASTLSLLLTQLRYQRYSVAE